MSLLPTPEDQAYSRGYREACEFYQPQIDCLKAEIERLTDENSTLSDRATRYMLARDAAYDEIERLRGEWRIQNDHIVKINAENAKLQAVVDAAIGAIESLDEGALGYGNSTEGHRWPLRDELLTNLRAALEGCDEKP